MDAGHRAALPWGFFRFDALASAAGQIMSAGLLVQVSVPPSSSCSVPVPFHFTPRESVKRQYPSTDPASRSRHGESDAQAPVYGRHLTDKGNTQKHVDLTVGRVMTILDGIGAVSWSDLKAEAV